MNNNCKLAKLVAIQQQLNKLYDEIRSLETEDIRVCNMIDYCSYSCNLPHKVQIYKGLKELAKDVGDTDTSCFKNINEQRYELVYNGLKFIELIDKEDDDVTSTT